MVREFLHRQQAAVSLVSAAAIWGMFGIYSRILGENFDVFTQFFARNLVMIFIVMGFVAVFAHRTWNALEKHDLGWIFGWVGTRAIAMILFFISVQNIQVGMAVLMFYAGSLINAYVMGAVLCSERLSARKGIAIILVLVGLLIIGFSDLDFSSFLNVGFALLSGIFGAAGNVFSKKFKGEYPATQLVIVDAFFNALLMLPLLLWFGSTGPALDVSLPWIIILVYAFSQFLANRLVIYGFRNLEAQKASLILPIDIVFASLFGFIFFKEIPTENMLIGGIFILVATISTVAPLPIPRMTNKGTQLFGRAYTYVRMGIRGEQPHND